VKEDLSVVCGMLGYFVCSGWSGLMGVVVNVVCLGCQTRGCCLGAGGAVRTFFRVGALFVW
jgi:hypothetical protein